ncbi:sesquipedalian-1-like [Pungitius pungitius]|uniref:sesquipedalian-1-like n=1 Tax=Pungitius pungitius TaxID=134920 RepID=UPI002E14C691
MKIHERIVSYFEACTSQVDKEGFLHKKGERKTSYQKRWFVLKGNLLFYKDRPADRDVTGVIVLEGCTVQLCESEEPFAFSLVWDEPGLRTYKFAAEDQAGQESWIKALLSANHSYLALLLMDLEKKYRDALGEFSAEPANPFVMPNFSAAEAGYAAAHPAVGAGPGSSQMLQPTTVSYKATTRRSPKLWPKRSANVEPAAPLKDWPGFSSASKEEFTRLHEDFGKEVKELIVEWSKKDQGAAGVEGENLIDFGE